MLQRYRFRLQDRTGRTEESVGTGNVVQAAAHAVLINAGLPRAEGGLGMMQPQITGVSLA